MGTTGDWSVRSLTALALTQMSIACGPPPPSAVPSSAASTPESPEATAAAATTPAAPSCGAPWCVVAGIPKQVAFAAVWGSSSTDVWVAGDGGTLLHWDGVAWSNPPSGTESELRALSGTSAKDVWAAGIDGTLLHFDGSSWSPTQSSGSPWSFAQGPEARPIYALLALPNMLWAGGSGTRAFDGTAWTEPHHASHLPTTAIWGLDSSTLWEVGLQGMVNRWDGHHWQRLGAEFGPNFFGVWGAAANDVWVVGSTGTIVRWNGDTPTPLDSGTKNDLYAVRGFSDRDIWAAGAKGTILHWQGSEWTPSTSPSPNALLGIWGASANDVWLVGENGVVLRHQG